MELKIETFSARRRPDWQSKPGTEVAVASLQNSNIKIAVNSGRRTAPCKTTEEENMASHKELRELMLICLHVITITTTTRSLFQYSHVSTWYYLLF